MCCPVSVWMYVCTRSTAHHNHCITFLTFVSDSASATDELKRIWAHKPHWCGQGVDLSGIFGPFFGGQKSKNFKYFFWMLINVELAFLIILVQK